MPGLETGAKCESQNIYSEHLSSHSLKNIVLNKRGYFYTYIMIKYTLKPLVALNVSPTSTIKFNVN